MFGTILDHLLTTTIGPILDHFELTRQMGICPDRCTYNHICLYIYIYIYIYIHLYIWSPPPEIYLQCVFVKKTMKTSGKSIKHTINTTEKQTQTNIISVFISTPIHKQICPKRALELQVHFCINFNTNSTTNLSKNSSGAPGPFLYQFQYKFIGKSVHKWLWSSRSISVSISIQIHTQIYLKLTLPKSFEFQTMCF